MAGEKNQSSLPGAGVGIERTSQEGGFPEAMLKASEDFRSALANCYIKDEDQRNSIILYAAQLTMFDMVDELEDLTNFLIASISINMTSRAQALQAHVGMFFPSTSGMKVGKEEMKYMKEANKESARSRDRHSNNGDKGDED